MVPTFIIVYVTENVYNKGLCIIYE